jgi:polysaccharide export outer membrane protein
MNRIAEFNRVILICCITCGIVLSAMAVCAQPDNVKVNYVIGPQDVLKIFVWNHAELSITVPVRIDGKISMPLVDDIQAAGNSPMELKEIIVSRLSKYIEQPTVSVIVEQINSLKIVILGNVIAPGVFNVGSTKTLVEAISLAGGLSQWANPKKIKVMRKKNGKEDVMEINYKQILSGENPEMNIVIYPDDIIIVP